MSTQEPQPFAGRYLPLRELASSPAATVYLAEDRELGRPVALKVLGAGIAGDPEASAHFRAAASAASAIRDPHVVATYDVDETEGRPYVAMEYVDGRSLADALPNGRSVSVQRAVMLATGIASGLAAAHRAGVVHGGLTPHNVLLTTNGDVKLTDFGTAGMGAGGDALERAECAAPEQLRGSPPDARTDVYALGAVLCSLVTGYPPFTGTDPVAVTEQKLAGPPVPASSRVAGVPPALDAVIAKLLEPSPAARYASSEEALADLRRVAVFAEPVTAVVTTTGTATAVQAVAPTATLPQADEAWAAPPPASPPKQRNTAIWVAVAVLVLAVGALAWWVFASRNEAEKSKVEVPAVVGQQRVAAEAAITAAGLSPSVSEVANADFGAGLVFDQSPKAGTELAKGDVVVLKVSTGPEPTTTTSAPATTTTTTTTTSTTTTSTTTTTTTTAPPGP